MQVQYNRVPSSYGQRDSTGVGNHFRERTGHNPGRNKDVASRHGHAYRGLPVRVAKDTR